MNLKGWEVSDADVRRAGESGAYRDFHNLNYLEYAYIQLGRYRDAQHTVDIIAAQYRELPDKKTAPTRRSCSRGMFVAVRSMRCLTVWFTDTSTCSLGWLWNLAAGTK